VMNVEFDQFGSDYLALRFIQHNGHACRESYNE
jgi:hypothetical protein